MTRLAKVTVDGSPRVIDLARPVAFDFHVDSVAGSDTADGTTPTTAWKTLTKVQNSTFPPGARIGLKRGSLFRSYLPFPSSGTAGNPITIGVYGPEADPKPIISGGEIVTGWTTYSGGTNTFQVSVTPEPLVLVRNGQILLRGTNRDTLADGEWRWTSGVLYVRDNNQSPNSDIYERGAREGAFRTDTKTDIVVQDITFQTCNGRALFFAQSSHRAAARRCSFRHTTLGVKDGVGTGYNGALSFHFTNDAIVEDCDFEGVYSDAIGGFNCLRPTVRRNTVGIVYGDASDNVQFDWPAEPTAGTGWLFEDNDFTFGSTTSHKGNGVMFGSGGTLRDTRCVGGNFGFSLPANDVTVTRVFYRGHGLLGSMRLSDNNAQPLGNQTYTDCVVLDSVNGINVESPSGSPNRTNLAYDHITIARTSGRAALFANPVSGRIRDSILWSPTRTTALVEVSAIVSGQAFTISDSIIGPELPGVPLIRWLGTNYNTLTAWQTATGNGVGCTVADPLFTDLDSDDLTLLPGSPALAAASDGTNLGGNPGLVPTS